VYYFNHWEEGFSTINKACMGDGFSDIRRTQDIWEVKEETDLFVFPDIGHSGLQEELESQGKRVWGGRRGDELELDRELFLKTLGDIGLDVPEFEVVVGITNLRVYLRDKENLYIKISRYRGMMETAHWRSWKEDAGLLDIWSLKWGPLGELVRWLVFQPIETDLEIGADTYCIDGQWPDTMLHGIEWKDKSYFAAVTSRKDMPDEVKAVLDAFGPVLAPYRYRNEFSMELRVTDDEAFFIDPTCRGGLPSTASQTALWKNFDQIIWHGANGEMVQPEPAGQFSAECVLCAKSPRKTWVVADIPPAIRDACKLATCCQLDGAACFPPDDLEGEEIGWLVAIGETPRETLDRMKELAAQLPDGISANTESLVDVIKEIESAEAEGIPFTEQAMPEPAEVIE